MKYFVILIVILIGFSITVTENAFAENCLPIELEYSIVGGNVTELCKSDTNVQVNAKIQAIDKGHLIIEIPQKVVYSLSGLNCELGELFVLMDGYETPLDNVTSDKNHNTITVSFQEGNHTIAFIGSTILPDPGPSDYCGIVMGYDFLYLPPKFQEKNGVSLKHIHCNENFRVLARYDDSAVCVKYDTRTKLIERGWGKNSLYQLDDKTIIENVNDLEEVKAFLTKYPNAEYSIIRDSWMAYYSVEGTLEEPYDNQSRTKRILIEIDPFGRPLWVGIECGGPVTLDAQSNVIELLNTPNWCFPDVSEIKSEPPGDPNAPKNQNELASKLWYEHTWIIDGTLVGIEDLENEHQYDIQINYFFKPIEESNFDLITAFGNLPFHTEIGDRALFYIAEDNNRLIVTWYSRESTDDCPPELKYVWPQLIDPPLNHGEPAIEHDYSEFSCLPDYYRDIWKRLF